MGRVQELRDAQPEWTADQLVERLIKRKCQQTAVIGAASAGSGLIPGIGTVVALTVGTVADVGATLRLQTELVMEIAAVHGHRLSPAEKRRVVMLVGGLSAGGSRALAQGGARLSLGLTQRFAQRWLARLVPLAGVGASAGVNAVSTYLIGRRAHAYFIRGPQALGSWTDSLRTLAGVDERRLGRWLGDAGKSVGQRARLALPRFGKPRDKTSPPTPLPQSPIGETPGDGS